MLVRLSPCSHAPQAIIMLDACPLIRELFASRATLPNPLRFDLTADQVLAVAKEASSSFGPLARRASARSH